MIKSIDNNAPDLSHAQFEQAKAKIEGYFKKKYNRKVAAKYGSLNIAFSDAELNSFLHQLRSKKFELLFKYQAFLGLRIGEACKINVSNFNLEKREITFISSKTHLPNVLLIPQGLFCETLSYMQKHEKEIHAAKGYLFFKDNDNNHNEVPYIDLDYARRIFRRARASAGLNEIYGFSDEKIPGRRSRPLYRLGSHSLRRYAVTKFHKVHRDIVLTSRFARHKSPRETIKYVANDPLELYQDIDTAFPDMRQRILVQNILKKS